MKIFWVTIAGMLFFISTVAWAETPRFDRKEETSNDWIVVDHATGLTWQGCPAGLTGALCRDGSIENIKALTWQKALEYCETLGYGGHNDWRLPNRRELFSIADTRSANPSIDVSKFPETPSAYFWSSSSYAGNSSLAWLVNFYYGYVYYDSKTIITRYARCVRGGP